MNVFEEKVFDDTSYTVCCFQFEPIKENLLLETFITFYPQNETTKVWFSRENNFSIGGEIYNIQKQNIYKICRLMKNQIPSTNIVVKCIDDTEKIGMKYSLVDELYIDTTANKTARSYFTLTSDPPISEKKQKILIFLFNKFLNEKRNKYNSLILTNYREGSRKRISFDLVYKIVGYVLTDKKFSNYFS